MVTTTLSASKTRAAPLHLVGRLVDGLMITVSAIAEGAAAAQTYRRHVERGCSEQEAARKTFAQHFAN
jgi:hypothetical protein